LFDANNLQCNNQKCGEERKLIIYYTSKMQTFRSTKSLDIQMELNVGKATRLYILTFVFLKAKHTTRILGFSNRVFWSKRTPK
jgi:hypothetical protein